METNVLVGLDLETTGVNIDFDEPVQVAAVYQAVKVDGEALDPLTLFNSFCKPSVEIGQEAEDIHKISEDMLRYSVSPYMAIKTLSLLINSLGNRDNVYTVGYNSLPFDLPIISRFVPEIAKYKHIDVYVLVLRELHAYGTKLSDVYTNYCGKDATDAHDAAADIFFTLAILVKYMENTNCTCEELYIRLAKPVAYAVFPFGKHKGKPIDSVPKSYAKWCLKNFDSLTPDLQLTLEYISR